MPKVPPRVSLVLDLLESTERSFLVSDGGTWYWLPKARVQHDTGLFTLPEELAREKGLI